MRFDSKQGKHIYERAKSHGEKYGQDTVSFYVVGGLDAICDSYEKAMQSLIDEMRALLEDAECEHRLGGVCYCSAHSAMRHAMRLLEDD